VRNRFARRGVDMIVRPSCRPARPSHLWSETKRTLSREVRCSPNPTGLSDPATPPLRLISWAIVDVDRPARRPISADDSPRSKPSPITSRSPHPADTRHAESRGLPTELKFIARTRTSGLGGTQSMCTSRRRGGLPLRSMAVCGKLRLALRGSDRLPTERMINMRCIQNPQGQSRRLKISGALAAVALASALSVATPSQAGAAGCGGYISSDSTHWSGNYKIVKVVNTCSSTRVYKVDIANGPDTGCASIGPYASYSYTYGYGWARSVLSC